MIIYCQLVVLSLSCLLFFVVSQRPNFRSDYRYEKAFKAFYKLHESAATWKEARVRCQVEGAQLIVPSSLDEADAMPLLLSQILTKFDGIFIGVHDLYAERFFVTVDGTPMLNSILNLLWEHEEPKYGAGRCVAMRRTGHIFVYPCDRLLPFICKKMKHTVQYNEECQSFNQNWKMGPNNTCYFLYADPQNWHQAYTTCLSAGGHLAIINDHVEATYIRELYKQADGRRMPNNDFAFLGFSDIFRKHHHRTIHGKRLKDLDYKNWDIQCPSDLSEQAQSGAHSHRCGGVLRTGLLSVGDCDVPAIFFCEKPPNITSSLTPM